MTVTLDLPPEIAEQLAVEATRRRLPLEEFLVQALRQVPKQPASGGVTTLGTPTFDPYLAIAGNRARAAAAELAGVYCEAQG